MAESEEELKSVLMKVKERQASLSITNSRSSLRLMSIESVMPSSHLIICPLLLLPPIPPSISNPEVPAFPGEEYEVPDTRLGEVSSALQ